MDPFVSFFVMLSLPVPCSLVTTWWEMVDLLALLCIVFSGVFVTFLYGVPGQE